ncbi:hypothetical protein A2609_01570 [Candidatus Kaiserbacteria bacterium RIFOXYD1_FULL_47_14]|uniref:Fido domain-containing protein n=1 Tax=Candidatus Kaiserbacteria bacterium RIFOXYD1_FULL_47_14 TaxID=1798533 RepID=A0A1F6G5H9_9BACT|nr:MAG: hypothetical protein A2609_01570 [Candidatus Kaiserbacteria bacterium RIFOXYD1_FULL_47_14]
MKENAPTLQSIPEESEEQFRTRRAERVVKFLEKIGALEYAKNILSNETNGEAPTFEEFKEFLKRINGIARDIPIYERRFDGEKVYIDYPLGDEEMPRHEDKEDILAYAYEARTHIDPEDIKYMLPAVINAVHLFSDGNGRTSRIMHLLLKDGSSKEDIKLALGKYGRWNSFDINPGIISFEIERIVLGKHGWVFKDSKPNGRLGVIETGASHYEAGHLDQNHPSYKEAEKLFCLYGKDSQYVLTAIHMSLGDGSVRDISSNYSGINRVSPQKMLATLQPEQWQKIIDNFYQLKKEHVETLVDIFVEPDKFIYDEKSGETLKDMFEREILQAHEKSIS